MDGIPAQHGNGNAQSSSGWDTAVEIPLKFKYRTRKPTGGYRSDYAGNSGQHRHKGQRGPVIGTGRTGIKTLIPRKRRLRRGEDTRSESPACRPPENHRGILCTGLRGLSEPSMRMRARRAPPRDQHERHPDLVLVHGPPRTVSLHGLQPLIVDMLSGRERDVLVLVAELHSNAEIALILCVSENTVKTHLRSAFLKLGVTTRRDAVRRARESGQLPCPLWERCPACHGTGRVPVLEYGRDQ